MTETERQLFAILQQRSFQRGEFKLASGGTSNYYIDARVSAVFSASAHLVGEVVYERTRDLAIDAIGGLAVGAVPIATAAAIAYHRHGRPLEGFWVRDQAKGHGTQTRIEGYVRPGSRVAVVDDVFTRGESGRKAVDAVREAGCEVVLVLALVDRLLGAEQLFRSHGIANYQAVFTIRDFGVEVDAAGGPG